jgi:pyruvate,water dikinase
LSTGRDIDFANPSAAARALEAVWSGEAGLNRRDALVIETVAATTTGVATTGSATDADWLAPAGMVPFTLPHLRHRLTPDADQPPYARRLQQLVRGVRRTFGPGAWRVEWADDGRICWLVQVLTVPQSTTQPAPSVPGAKA